MSAPAANVLDVADLRLAFRARGETVPALAGVSLNVAPREIVGIVGESGSGKSVTALSVMGLLPTRKAVIDAGHILFMGQELLQLHEPELRRMRSRN